MSKETLSIRDVVEKLKEIDRISNIESVPTSTYDNFLFYLEAQNLMQNIIKDDSNNVFRAFSDAIGSGQISFSPVRTKLIEKLQSSQNQLKHLCQQYLEMEAEEYLEQVKSGSVDTMIDLAFLLNIYEMNLRLFYFHKDSSLVEIKLPACGQDAEYVSLFYFQKKFHSIKEIKQQAEETKIDLSGYRKKNIARQTNIQDQIPEESSVNQSMMSKSKSTILTGQIFGLQDDQIKMGNINKRDSYKKKGMCSTSSAFVPPNKFKV